MSAEKTVAAQISGLKQKTKKKGLAMKRGEKKRENGADGR